MGRYKMHWPWRSAREMASCTLVAEVQGLAEARKQASLPETPGSVPDLNLVEWVVLVRFQDAVFAQNRWPEAVKAPVSY